MRDIKFRGQIKGSYVVSTGLPEWHYFVINPGCVLDLDDIENICQYIGLKDAEGNEIYEGDIVKYKHPREPHNNQPCDFIGVVEYVDCVASYRVVNDSYGFEEVIHLDVILEVIGNIHENPELLD